MGCSNSQLRPIFRRCRRRRSKKEEVTVSTPKVDLIERNGSAQDLLQGVQLLGASLRHNSSNNANSSMTTVPLTLLKQTAGAPPDNPTTDPSAFPLLAQSEASTSQIDFFKMLDQKIEEGPDYNSDDDDRFLQRHSLPTSSLRLESGTERRALRHPGHKASPLKFTHWNWDEEGD